MSEAQHFASRWMQVLRRSGRDERAAQLVEFAVSLPLLVVFVVGIFDFSGAFNLKQKLTGAARDGARASAALPSNDLGNAFAAGAGPFSVTSAFQVIDNYLAAERINDCGLSGTTPTPTGSMTWTYSSTGNGCPGIGIILTINRGYVFPRSGSSLTSDCSTQVANPAGINVVGTCVSIQYAYQWRFGSVISLLGSAASLPSTLKTVAVAMNEN